MIPTLNKPMTPVKLYSSSQAPPTSSDWTTFDSLISPRKCDGILCYEALQSHPTVLASVYNTATTTNPTMSGFCWAGQSTSTLTSLTDGTWDSHLIAMAQSVASVSPPYTVWFRLCHEFNGGWYPWGNGKETAVQYVTAWHYIINLMRANWGSADARVTWCPNVWSEGAAINPLIDDGSGSNWYPGDNYVDVLGLDGYMGLGNNRIYWPEDIFLANYQSLVALAPTKPFVIAEVGCAEDVRFSKAEWFNRLFTLIQQNMPKTELIGYWERSGAPEYLTINSDGANPAAGTAFSVGVNTYPFV